MKVHRVLPVMGVPVSDLTADETLEEMAAMIEDGEADLIATANVDHAMRCRSDVRFREALCGARLVTADGMPLVWASRLSGAPLRERVTGADLLPRACEMAAQRGYRAFLMGGLPDTADRAADRLIARFPGLQIAGTYCPRFASLEDLDHESMCDAVRRARPDLLFTSLGSPKGTLWLARHLDVLEVPVCLEIGAALNFAAGLTRRAPRWMRAGGAEWAFRLIQEPGRLGQRYRRNALFLLRTLAQNRIARGPNFLPPCGGRLGWGGGAPGISPPTQRCAIQGEKVPGGWAISTSRDRGTLGRVHPTAATTVATAEGDRRRQPRVIVSENDAWRVTRQVARRMDTGLTVEADLRTGDVRRSNLLGALVWLHRRAVRASVALSLHGLPTGLAQAAAQLGGPRFAQWMAASGRVGE